MKTQLLVLLFVSLWALQPLFGQGNLPPVYPLIITLFLLARSSEKQTRFILRVFIAAFGTWTVWGSFTSISLYPNRWFGLTLYAPMNANWQTVETICLYVIVFYFNWILLQRFSELRKQVLQKEWKKRSSDVN